MKPGSAASLVLLGILAGCSPRSEDASPPHADWVIKSQVVFVAADGKTARAAPKQPLRLWVPYVVGDIYGAPNAGELAPVVLQPDLSFTINLNLRYVRRRMRWCRPPFRSNG